MKLGFLQNCQSLGDHFIVLWNGKGLGGSSPHEWTISLALELKGLQEQDGIGRESAKLEQLGCQTEGSMPAAILR